MTKGGRNNGEDVRKGMTEGGQREGVSERKDKEG